MPGTLLKRGATMTDGTYAQGPQSRTLVLCFDGTANEYDGTNTNIPKLFALLDKSKPSEQLCYYQAGIGTYFKPGMVSPLFQWGAAKLDEAIAWYLDQHIMDGYTFIMQNWKFGDKIVLFGFSRGAYTARALAGMLLKMGLLSRDNPQQVPFAYKLYTRTDPEGVTLAAGFKQTFCTPVEIEFIGVWDTVASVGVISSPNLPFVESNSSVKTFRHALSLDEHRAKFRPSLYHRPPPNYLAGVKNPNRSGGSMLKKPSAKKTGGPLRRATKLFRKGSSKKGKDPRISDEEKVGLKDDEYRVSDAGPEPVEQHHHHGNGKQQAMISPDGRLVGNPAELQAGYATDVLEVWFAGCHGDVGGGNVPDTTKDSLAAITLRWMVREVMTAQCGVIFDTDALHRESIPTGDFPPGTSTTAGSKELAMDSVDMDEPEYDQLKANWLWWLLEIIPLPYSWQDDQGVWHRKWSFHLGAGRLIPTACPNFHITVKERMADATLKWKPKAQYTPGTEVFVE